MNVILFDIDGTLMLTDRAGQSAMEQVVPTSGNGRNANGSRKKSDDMDYAGRTDRSIVADHLGRLGVEDTIENFLEFTQSFLQRLPDSLAARDGFVLPGVLETLQRLQACSTIHLGLLTGNLRRAAGMKLSHFNLDPFFLATGDFVGGFGDEHHDRADVARVALAEARRHFEPDLDPQQVWIIGDTPNDVKCARAIGANVLSVSTGGYSAAQLQETTPDLHANDLTTADHWWQCLQEANPTL